MALDNKFEFNCPQYYDFGASSQDDSIDTYFDFNHEDELQRNSFETEIIKLSAGMDLPLTLSSTQDSYIQKCHNKKSPYIINKKDSKCQSEKIHMNNPSSLHGAFYGKENALSDEHESKRQRISETLQKCIYNLRSSSSSLQLEKSKVQNSKKSFALKDITKHSVNSGVNRSASLTSRNSTLKTGQKPLRRSITTSAVKLVPKLKKLTLPSTPSCIRHAFLKTTDSGKNIKSSEDLELEKIAQFHKQLAAHRKLNEKTFKKAMAIPSSSHNISLPSHHTVVKPFNFATDERIKINEPKHAEKIKDFVSSLREHVPKSLEKASMKTTKPVPFKLAENRKRKRSGEFQETYQSLAEKVIAFEKGERIQSGRNDYLEHSNQQKVPVRTTNPHSPKLHALARQRPITVLSHQQLEELNIEEMRKYKFKAKPVNPKLFTEASGGIPKIERRPATKAKDIFLQTQKRYWLRDRNTVDEPQFEFHAQPVPLKILKGIVGLKEKTTKPVTQGKSPSFAVTERQEVWKQRNKDLKEGIQLPSVKTRPVLHSGCPFSVKWEKKNTIMQPFSFDVNDQMRWIRKEEKIKVEIEKEKKMHEFHARPMPKSSPKGIPERKTKACTKPQPFSLIIDKRGEERASKWQKEVQEELNKQTGVSVFKAQPAVVIYKQPFVPEKSQKPLTRIDGVYLNTEHRASEREAFNEYKKRKEAELEAEFQRQKEMEKEMEKEALINLRAEIVHKAKPIKHFKSVEVRPSDKELTHPCSPQFATALRLRSHK